MKKELYCTPETKYMETGMEPLLSGTITEQVPENEDGENDIELDAKTNHLNVWDD